VTAGEGIRIKLVGDKELLRKLDRLQKKDARKAIRRGLRAGAKILAVETKRLVPKVTGAIKRAVRVRAGKRSRRYIAVLAMIGEGWFKGDSFYAAQQEMGWHAGKRTGYSKTYKAGAKAARGRAYMGRRWIEGKHFMERAAQNRGRAAANAALNIIRQEVEASARKPA
jgi:HK97 gp10 family phage protein